MNIKENTKQSKGLKRNVIDKFYTKPEVVNVCIHFIKDNMAFDDNDAIIEPSSGNGSFIDGIKPCFMRSICSECSSSVILVSPGTNTASPSPSSPKCYLPYRLGFPLS